LLYGLGCHAQKPQNGLFFVAAVTPGIDSDGDQFTPLTPALDSESGDAQDLGDFANGEEIGEVVETQ